MLAFHLAPTMELTWQTSLSLLAIALATLIFGSVIMGFFGGNQMPVDGKVRPLPIPMTLVRIDLEGHPANCPVRTSSLMDISRPS